MSAIIRVETCILKGGFSYNGNVPIPPYNKLDLTDSGNSISYCLFTLLDENKGIK